MWRANGFPRFYVLLVVWHGVLRIFLLLAEESFARSMSSASRHFWDRLPRCCLRLVKMAPLTYSTLPIAESGQPWLFISFLIATNSISIPPSKGLPCSGRRDNFRSGLLDETKTSANLIFEFVRELSFSVTSNIFSQSGGDEVSIARLRAQSQSNFTTSRSILLPKRNADGSIKALS